MTCPKCSGAMEEGHIPDAADTYHVISNWIAGPPSIRFWGNLKVRGAAKFPVAVWRCSSCGFLEFYAKPE